MEGNWLNSFTLGEIVNMVLLTMVFLHILNDFNIQGWLANAKQKQWWSDNAPQSLYKFDYIFALIVHSFSWTFMVMLPILYVLNWVPTVMFYSLFVVNIILHAVIDDIKANKKKINLIADQSMHLGQILITFILFVFTT